MYGLRVNKYLGVKQSAYEKDMLSTWYLPFVHRIAKTSDKQITIFFRFVDKDLFCKWTEGKIVH